MDQARSAVMHWAIARTMEEKPGQGVYYKSGI